jgi:tetratricopeptide (TPR) repeat protein
MRGDRSLSQFFLALVLATPIAPFAPILNPRSEVFAQTQTVPLLAERSPESIQRLLETAKQHFRRAEFKPAIALYQQVLDQPSSIGNAKIEALLQLGDIHFWIDQVPQAEIYFQQALKLARDNQDRAGEAGALAGMGEVYRNRQEYPKALEALKTALATNQQMGDSPTERLRQRKGEARSRLILGTVFYWQAQYPQALAAFQQALKVTQADNSQDEMALIYNWMAVTYRELKDNKQAEQWIQQQQALSQTIGYRTAEYSGLWAVASLQQQQKQPEQALQTYQKQLAIAQAADNPWFQRSVLLEIGWLYVNQKQTPKALEAYQKALILAKTIDNAAVADVQNRIGVAYYRAEQYPKAAEAYQQALAIYLKTKNNQASIAQVWINIGDVKWALKTYPEFIEAYQKALPIYQQLKNENALESTYYWIGNAYW